MARKFNLPDLSNATPSMLIDEIGKMSAMSNYLKKSIDVYKEALYARTGKTEQHIEGERYQGEIKKSQRVAVDQTAVKEKYPMENFPELYSTTEVFSLRCSSPQDPELDAWLKQLREELDL